MKPLTSTILSLLLIAMPVAALAQEGDRDVEVQRKELQDARLKVLKKFFRLKSDAQEVLESAKGYAVFYDLGLNFGLVSTLRGGGILRHNRTGVDLYYSMSPVGGGFAPGSRGYAAIFVFHSVEAMAQFEQEGWDATTATDASLAFEEDTGPVEVAASALPGATVYRFSDSDTELRGARFWKDDALN